MVRGRLFAPDSGSHTALVAAIQRKGLREAARNAARDPAIAWELRIGRPDLRRRRFDDGGLIDVNHVPPAVLSAIPGMTPDLVEHIVAARAKHRRFGSVQELSMYVRLPPGLARLLAEYAIFL